MSRVSHESGLPRAEPEAAVGEPTPDDVANWSAYDEQLRQGATPHSTVCLGDQQTPGAPPAELVECLNLIERIWPRSTPLAAASALPSRIGHFEIERVLGQGGFGIVYLAQDTALHRPVALKVPRLHSLADHKLRERFHREAHAAAGLDHPNVVPIYEAGEDGPICYIASAYCAGPNLYQWIKQQSAPICPRLAAAILAKLADAAHYSHTQGIFHRDVKPSNVMLVPRPLQDSSSGDDELPFIPRLTDFGLAKLLDGSLDETAASATLGTPAYMAPEQADGSAERVGPHTDVYALGTVLYELLAGRPPFQGSSVAEVLDEVRNSDPVPPRRLRREIPRDLEIVCLKCLEKHPAQRYKTARELSDDLNRFLHGEPIRARRPGTAYTAFKWMRRRPALAFAAAVSSLAVLALLLGGLYYNYHLTKALQVAQRLQDESVDRERLLRLQMYAADLRLAWKAWEAGDTDETLRHLARHRPQRGADDLRGFEWHFLLASCQPGNRTLRGHLTPILAADVSPDDKLIASGDRGGTVKIWDLATGSELQTLQYSTQEVTSVRFAPDGRTLATAGLDRTIRLWKLNDFARLVPRQPATRLRWTRQYAQNLGRA
jgi:eukaryotic-like serine/threonine-protein kinase